MYNTYLKYVRSYVYRKIRDKHDAEEIIQDIFTDVWLKRSAIRSHAVVWAIAKHKCIDFFRKKRIRFKSYEEYIDMFICQDKQQEQQTDFLQKLSCKEKQMVSLFVDGYERKEVAKILGVALGTVDSRLHRLREKLQK
ncbi:RNA polymerase sigma factor [Candidatus Uabimicrobium sp. HlEnr_7]|uniref:RNA polymerase sigma factor n=1 Tax=Candidatus Uabimicrobium helgolandensis TaxID=3095367 RepID=UPI003558E1D9